jgi:signal transduction histidine kinase
VAEGRPGRASVRLRTTAGAVLVVAIALLVGAFILVALVRGSLRDGLETSAEQRASALAEQIKTSGLPEAEPADDDGGLGDPDDPDDPDDLDDLDDLVWQVTDAGGTVVRSSQPLSEVLPTEDADEVRLRGADHSYVVATDDASAGDQQYDVAVAVSLEEVDDSTAALVTPLLVGLPLVLLLVGGTTWVVATRALAPVERIRREVEQITGDRLDRRVPEPRSRDEIHRMAQTMNQMLGRLEDSRDRQQQFVADASHELRSPLASIRQTAEVARAHPGALPEGELAEAVLEESARMQRLVEQLLLLTRADEGAVTRTHHDVDLDDLALAEARRVGRSGLAVETSGVGAGRVRGDQTSLAQVVRNLVDNAARHADQAMMVAVREADGGVELIVEDDGPGIPEDQRQRVFERFVRLDEARARDAGGSGLGLAIVREIVAAHGGTVAVSSSGLGGARFVVRLAAPTTGPDADLST